MKFTPEELAMLREAIDSHIYWQLSDEHYRDDGAVEAPGSDDPEVVDDIRKFNELAARLEGE